jgi:hypothetical protein
MTEGSRLSRKHEEAIAALLTSRTVVAAARKAGVAERTLRDWLSEPAFCAGYRAARRAVLTEAIARLQQAAVNAVRTLERNLKCGRPSAEIKAAGMILELAVGAGELAELIERVAALEAANKKGRFNDS